jgi:hypothetical protein
MKKYLYLFTSLIAFNQAIAQAGVLDSTFGTNGSVLTTIGNSDDIGYSIATQPDGKIVVTEIPEMVPSIKLLQCDLIQMEL